MGKGNVEKGGVNGEGKMERSGKRAHSLQSESWAMISGHGVDVADTCFSGCPLRGWICRYSRVTVDDPPY